MIFFANDSYEKLLSKRMFLQDTITAILLINYGICVLN